MRADHIFISNEISPTSADFCLLPYGMVVEASPIQSLPADCPMLIIFKHSHLCMFHHYVVATNL